MTWILKQRTEYDIPKEHFFNCKPFKQEGELKHALSHTGYHYDIIESVLTHPEFYRIVWKKFQKTWADWQWHTKTDDYLACFVCKSGCHRSIAALLGAKYFFDTIKIPVEVRLVNIEDWRHRKCVNNCWYCKDSWQKTEMMERCVGELMYW